jgi:hypothetical protein
MWQDIILSIIGVVFTIVLIPQLKDVIKNKCKMNIFTCILTSSGCFLISYVDFSLNLPISSIVSATTGIIWGLMLYYSLSIDDLMNNIKYSYEQIISMKGRF